MFLLFFGVLEAMCSVYTASAIHTFTASPNLRHPLRRRFHNIQHHKSDPFFSGEREREKGEWVDGRSAGVSNPSGEKLKAL